MKNIHAIEEIYNQGALDKFKRKIKKDVLASFSNNATLMEKFQKIELSDLSFHLESTETAKNFFIRSGNIIHKMKACNFEENMKNIRLESTFCEQVDDRVFFDVVLTIFSNWNAILGYQPLFNMSYDAALEFKSEQYYEINQKINPSENYRTMTGGHYFKKGGIINVLGEYAVAPGKENDSNEKKYSPKAKKKSNEIRNRPQIRRYGMDQIKTSNTPTSDGVEIRHRRDLDMEIMAGEEMDYGDGISPNELMGGVKKPAQLTDKFEDEFEGRHASNKKENGKNSEGESRDNLIESPNNQLTPKGIKKLLDLHVIGQEEVKKTMAMHSFYYLQSLFKKPAKAVVTLPKSNVLLIGDTGSGKTLLLKTLSEVLNIPFINADASAITPSGYKGCNLNTILRPLVNDERISKGRVGAHGIIFIDEFDKMIIKADDKALGLNIQNEFLKLIEGADVNIYEDDEKGEKSKTLDTRNLMFVFAGSFTGLKDIIQKRLGASGDIKVSDLSAEFDETLDKNKLLKHVNHEDMMKFGVNREFLGRVSVIKSMDSVGLGMMRDIFSKPKNSIYNQYKEKLAMLGIDLKFTEDAIDYIVNTALNSETGARALDNIVEEIMGDVLYKIPGEKDVKLIEVDKRAAIKNAPTIKYEPGIDLKRRDAGGKRIHKSNFDMGATGNYSKYKNYETEQESSRRAGYEHAIDDCGEDYDIGGYSM